MRPSLQTRLAWFDRGAEALRRTCPTATSSTVGPVYACPLCLTRAPLRLFLRDAVSQLVLTAEHVPPDNAGGRPMLLTCASCNNTAGTELDWHLGLAVAAEQHPPGTLRNYDVRATVGGVTLNMTMDGDVGSVQLFGAPSRNNPANTAAFLAHLQEMTRSGSTDWNIQLQFREQFDGPSAAVSLLRAGYLAAFAKFGYRWILSPAVKIVRDKIDTPALPLPSLFSMTIPTSTTDARAVIALSEPADLAGGLGVLMGRHLVLLPGPNDLTFYDRVAAKRGQQEQLNGTVLQWPTRPEMLWDLTEGA